LFNVLRLDFSLVDFIDFEKVLKKPHTETKVLEHNTPSNQIP